MPAINMRHYVILATKEHEVDATTYSIDEDTFNNIQRIVIKNCGSHIRNVGKIDIDI